MEPLQPTEKFPLTFIPILLADAWQIFAVLACASGAGFLLFTFQEFERLNIPFTVAVSYLSEILLALWFYAVGSNLYRLRPFGVSLSFGRFVFNLAYFLFYSLVLLYASTRLLVTGSTDTIPFEFVVLMPFHLYAVIAAFSIVAFVAKAIACFDEGRELHFEAYAGTFLLLFFFPFGIWMVQPRIQAIARTRIDQMDDLADELLKR